MNFFISLACHSSDLKYGLSFFWRSTTPMGTNHQADRLKQRTDAKRDKTGCFIPSFSNTDSYSGIKRGHRQNSCQLPSISQIAQFNKCAKGMAVLVRDCGQQHPELVQGAFKHRRRQNSAAPKPITVVCQAKQTCRKGWFCSLY